MSTRVPQNGPEAIEFLRGPEVLLTIAANIALYRARRRGPLWQEFYEGVARDAQTNLATLQERGQVVASGQVLDLALDRKLPDSSRWILTLESTFIQPGKEET